MLPAFDQAIGNLLFEPDVDFFPRCFAIRSFPIDAFREDWWLRKGIFEAISVIDRGHPCGPVLLVTGGGDVQILTGLKIDARHYEVQFRVALIAMQNPCHVEGVRLFPGEHEVLEVLNDLFKLALGWVVVLMEGQNAGGVFPAAMIGVDQVAGDLEIALEDFRRDFPTLFLGQILLD